MFNSALEFMGRAITREDSPQLGTALDIGSAAVLTASLGPDEDPFAHCASVARAGDYHGMG